MAAARPLPPTWPTMVLPLAALVAAMLLCQAVLDPRRRPSLHCFVRNALILYTLLAYLYFGSPAVLAAGLALTLAVEVAIEAGFQAGFVLDPPENKIKNCYSWMDIVMKSSKDMGHAQDLTEGLYACDAFKPYAEAQRDQRAWILDQGKVGPGVRVLDVGSGNCNLLEMVKARGGIGKGITLSSEQRAYCRRRGMDVQVLNFWDLRSSDLVGKFDVVVLNGPLEHFVQQYETGARKEAKYREVFEILRACLDPASAIGRVVITCIHMAKPFSQYSLGDLLQVYIYERSYGGNLPVGRDGLTRNARPWFDVVRNEDHTMDYYIASRYWWTYFNKANWEPLVFLKCLLLYPVYLLNDPYILHKLLHQVFGSWTWQFTPPPPNSHQWIVLQAKK